MFHFGEILIQNLVFSLHMSSAKTSRLLDVGNHAYVERLYDTVFLRLKRVH